MSTRGLKITSFTDGSRYSQHDDRTQQGRGSFRGQHRNRSWQSSNYRSRGRSRGYGPPRGGSVGPRSRLDEEGDAAMDGEASVRKPRFSPYSAANAGRWRRGTDRGYERGGRGGRGRGRGRGDHSFNRGDGGMEQWYKISIPYGRKSSKEFLLKSLTDLSALPFIPHNFHWNMQAGVFFVKGEDPASALYDCSRKFTLPNGFKALVLVRPSGPPRPDLTPELLNEIKTVLGQRWNSELNLLNLTSLHLDGTLQNQNVRLHDTKVLSEITRLIKESVPQIRALDLRENNLQSLAALSDLNALKELQMLNLQSNKLESLLELDKLRDLPLTELILDGNPLCDAFRNKEDYVREVRKKFPKIVQLDGNALPAVATFDLDSTQLPAPKGSFIANADIEPMVKNFISQYMAVYDRDKRDDLLAVYHEAASFSLSVCRSGRGGHAYVSESRNLARVTDKHRRQKMVRHGRLTIVGFLNSLPKTTHDPASLVIDTPFLSPAVVLVVVNGVFKEREESSHVSLRAFTRVLSVAPGPVIVSEMLTLTAPSVQQIKNSFKSPAPTPSPSPDVTSPAPSISSAASPVLPAQRDAAVAQFARQSGMNPEWSKQCLEMNGWDFDKAARNFVELKQNGKIPAEAFVASP